MKTVCSNIVYTNTMYILHNNIHALSQRCICSRKSKAADIKFLSKEAILNRKAESQI